MPELYKKAYITQLLLAANVLVFLAETAFGGSQDSFVAMRFGALFTPYVLDGAWYRVVTSMFLHFGSEHLCSNMISLFAIGPYLERMLGKLPYLLLYLASGICGNLCSILMDLITQEAGLSAGASGAICGLFGAILFFAILPRTRKLFPLRNVALALVCTLAPGIADHSINMAAHLGGVAGGFVSAALIQLYYRLLKHA